MKLKCQLCKKAFESIRKTKKYCTECKLIKKREWNRKYKHSIKGIESRKKYDRSEVGKNKYRRFRLTNRYKQYAHKRYELMDENIKKARYYINNALRDKKIIKADKCEMCGKHTRLEGHHYKGYEPQFWLTVEWLCPDCHKAVM